MPRRNSDAERLKPTLVGAPQAGDIAGDTDSRIALGVFAVACAVAIAIRLHRLDLPLERDEGEYGYGARLILDGDFSYDTLRTLKLPGVHLALTPFLALFGDTPSALRVALMVFDAGSACAFLALARCFVAARTAALSTAIFVIAQTSLVVLGLFAHAENFALLPALVGLLLAVRAARGASTHSWGWSGLAFGVAFVMKQPAILFGLLALFGLWSASKTAGARAAVARTGVFLSGCALPYALVCVWMAVIGHFEAFWFTTVTYARAYGQGATLEQGRLHLEAALADIGSRQSALAALFVAGLVALAARRALRPLVVWCAALFVVGAVATSVGLYFRAHYFVLLLPAVAIVAAIGAESLAAWTVRAGHARARVAAVIVCSAASAGLWFERDVAWLADREAVSRSIYYPNPFAESALLADVIRQRTQPGDKVAVLGSEPQIAFLAGRRSATGFVYMYPLFEVHEHAAWMQERTILEIEAAAPRVFLSVNVRQSWLQRQKSLTRIIEWAATYTEKHYRVIGVLDLDSQSGGRWYDAAALTQGIRLPTYSVMVFERVAGS